MEWYQNDTPFMLERQDIFGGICVNHFFDWNETSSFTHFISDTNKQDDKLFSLSNKKFETNFARPPKVIYETNLQNKFWEGKIQK